MPATCTTVEAAAEHPGVSVVNSNVFVNGNSATNDTTIKDGDALRVAERPKGS